MALGTIVSSISGNIRNIGHASKFPFNCLPLFDKTMEYSPPYEQYKWSYCTMTDWSPKIEKGCKVRFTTWREGKWNPIPFEMTTDGSTWITLYNTEQGTFTNTVDLTQYKGMRVKFRLGCGYGYEPSARFGITQCLIAKKF